MNIGEVFNEFELDLSNGKDYITCLNKKMSGVIIGVLGEHEVYNELRKFTNNIQTDIVIWNKKHTFTTEVDFVCNIDGSLFLIEAKDWFGTILPSDKLNEIIVKCTKFNGKTYINPRVNPRYQVSGFESDLRRYLKNLGYSKITIHKLVVFTRRELEIQDDEFYDKDKVCYLDELTNKIKELLTVEAKNPFNLDFQLPSWDYCYDSKVELWSKKTILNDSIETDKEVIDMKLIDSLYFDDYKTNHVYIKMKDGNIIERNLNRHQLITDRKGKCIGANIQYIKLDPKLHE